MQSPIQMNTILLAYVFLSVYVGPRLMANRKPFRLNTAMIIYNLSMVLLNAYIVYEVRKTTHGAVRGGQSSKPFVILIVVNGKMSVCLLVFFCHLVYDVRMGYHLHMEMWPYRHVQQPTGSTGSYSLFVFLRQKNFVIELICPVEVWH